MTTKANKFYGGVHPHEGKLSRRDAILAAPLQPLYTVPLQMHIGAPAKAVVAKGDKVLRGQVLGEAGGFVSAPVHSPTSGTVREVTTCLGVNGAQLPALVIESDGEDTECEPMPAIADWENADPKTLLKRIADAGIVGMGGAAFPTADRKSVV